MIRNAASIAMRRNDNVTTLFSRRSLARPSSIFTSTWPRYVATVPDLASQIEILRQEERRALFELQQRADTFIRHAERIIAVARASPSPDMTMFKPGEKQYISTERYTAASKLIATGQSVIAHVREIQEHCKDLEQETFPDWQYESTTSAANKDDSELVALKNEEKSKRTEILARLQQLKHRCDLAKRVIDIASRGQKVEAQAYLKESEGWALLDRAPLPPPSPLVPPTPRSASLHPIVPPTAILHTAVPPTADQDEELPDADVWNDSQSQLDMQLEEEEALFRKTVGRGR